ncbi:MAG: hypothetical protein K6G10_01510 [Butyrivibrio sp.]|nr:hypothetical protein [Butyrivibrio sp.]
MDMDTLIAENKALKEENKELLENGIDPDEYDKLSFEEQRNINERIHKK